MLKKLSNPSVILNIILIITLIGIFLFGPYKPLHSLNSEAIIEDPGLSKALKDYDVESIKYKGNNTYFIDTKTKDFIAVRDYFSTMDYNWKLFGFEEEIDYSNKKAE